MTSSWQPFVPKKRTQRASEKEKNTPQFLEECFFEHLFLVGEVEVGGVLLESTEGACRNTNALTVQANCLQVYVLTTSCGDVGVTTRVSEQGAFSGQLADAGHRGGESRNENVRKYREECGFRQPS